MTSLKDSLGSWSFLFGPTVAVLMLVVVLVLLKWAFARGRSVVTPAATEDFLVEVGRFGNAIEAEYFRCVLDRAGIESALRAVAAYQLLLVPESKTTAAKALLRAHSID